MPEFTETFDNDSKYQPDGLDKTTIAAGLLQLLYNTTNQAYEAQGVAKTTVNLNPVADSFITNVTFTPSGVNLPWNQKLNLNSTNYGSWTQSQYHVTKVISGVTGIYPDFPATRQSRTDFNGNQGTLNYSGLTANHYSVTGQKYGEVLPFCGSIDSSTANVIFNISPMEDMGFENSPVTPSWTVRWRNGDSDGVVFTSGSLMNITSRHTADRVEGDSAWMVSGNYANEAGTTWNNNLLTDQSIFITYIGSGLNGSLPISPVKYLNGAKFSIKNRMVEEIAVSIRQGTTIISSPTTISIPANNTWTTAEFTLAPATGSANSNDISIVITAAGLVPTNNVNFSVDNFQIKFARGALDSANLTAGSTALSAGPRTTGVWHRKQQITVSGGYGLKAHNTMTPALNYVGGFLDFARDLSSVSGTTLNSKVDLYPALTLTPDSAVFVPYTIGVAWSTGVYYGNTNKATWTISALGEYFATGLGVLPQGLQSTINVGSPLRDFRGSGTYLDQTVPFLSASYTGLDSVQTSTVNLTQTDKRYEGVTVIKNESGYHFIKRYGNSGGLPQYVNSGFTYNLPNEFFGGPSIGNAVILPFGFDSNGHVCWMYLTGTGSSSSPTGTDTLTRWSMGSKFPLNSGSVTTQTVSTTMPKGELLGGHIASGSDGTKQVFVISSGLSGANGVAYLGFANNQTLVSRYLPNFLGYTLTDGRVEMSVSGEVAHIVAPFCDTLDSPYRLWYFQISGTTVLREEPISDALALATGESVKMHPYKVQLYNGNARVIWSSGGNLDFHSPASPTEVTRAGESITWATSSQYPGAIAFKVKKIATPTGNILFTVRDGNGGITGSIIASGTVPMTAFIRSGYDIVHAPITGSTQLVNGSGYTVNLEYDAPLASGRLMLETSTGSTYANGTGMIYSGASFNLPGDYNFTISCVNTGSNFAAAGFKNAGDTSYSFLTLNQAYYDMPIKALDSRGIKEFSIRMSTNTPGSTFQSELTSVTGQLLRISDLGANIIGSAGNAREEMTGTTQLIAECTGSIYRDSFIDDFGIHSPFAGVFTFTNHHVLIPGEYYVLRIWRPSNVSSWHLTVTNLTSGNVEDDRYYTDVSGFRFYSTKSIPAAGKYAYHWDMLHCTGAYLNNTGSNITINKVLTGTSPVANWPRDYRVAGVTGVWLSAATTGADCQVIAKGFASTGTNLGVPTLSDIGPIDVVTGTWNGGFGLAISRSVNPPFETGMVVTKFGGDMRPHIAFMHAALPYSFATGTSGFTHYIPHLSYYQDITATQYPSMWYVNKSELYVRYNYKTNRGSWEAGDTTYGVTFDDSGTVVTINNFANTFTTAFVRPLSTADQWRPSTLQSFVLEGRSRTEYFVTRNNRNYFQVTSGANFTFNSANETDGNDDFTDLSASADAAKSTLKTRIQFYS